MKQSQTRCLLVISGSIFALFTGLLSGCSSTEPATRPSAPDVVETSAEEDNARVIVGDFAIQYELFGRTSNSQRIEIVPNPALSMTLDVGDGQQVTAGQVLGRAALSDQVAAEMLASSAANRIAATQLDAFRGQEGELIAPVDGTISQTESGIAIDNRGIDVVSELSGLQVLRLGAVVFAAEATVESTVGTRTVACTATWIDTSIADIEGRATFHCRLPQTVETAGGLRAAIKISSEPMSNVTMVPNSMLSLAQDGYEITLEGQQGPETIPVSVGPTNGVMRVVYTQLPPGTEILPPGTR